MLRNLQGQTLDFPNGVISTLDCEQVKTHLNFVTKLGAPEGGYEEDISTKLNIVFITIFAGSHTQIFKVDKKS